jgi:hypothetical protein
MVPSLPPSRRRPVERRAIKFTALILFRLPFLVVLSLVLLPFLEGWRGGRVALSKGRGTERKGEGGRGGRRGGGRALVVVIVVGRR